MDDFKLRSIEEFDSYFINESRVESKAALSSKQSDLIPEINFNSVSAEPEKAETVEETPASGTYFSDISSTKTKTPRPLTPIGQTPSPYAPNPKTESEIAESEDDEIINKNSSRKSGKGVFAGKIISIAMLSVTVVFFLLGCFTATFLDTFEIAGYNLSTQYTDTENPKLSQGDLVVSKVLEPSEYAVNQFVMNAVVYNDGTDEKTHGSIGMISSVSSYGDSAALEIIDISTGSVETVNSAECKGEVLFYIPYLAGILNFALQADNAILVCALFVLLAAFWCLLLVLLSKASKKNNEPEVDLINE